MLTSLRCACTTAASSGATLGSHDENNEDSVSAALGSGYALPAPVEDPSAPPRTAYLVASGDLRLSANLAGWPTQQAMERSIRDAFASLGWEIVRAHPEDGGEGHGFISSQRHGIEI